MRLTLYTDYALRTLMYLGLADPAQASIAEISRAYGISENHLTKMVHHLGRLGLVKTTRGRGGGLRLAQPADRIIIGGVVRQTEEDLSLVECFSNETCMITSSCRLQKVLKQALNGFLSVLDQYTLADLLVAGKGRETARILGLRPPLISKYVARRLHQ